jgi:hypothetical protein
MIVTSQSIPIPSRSTVIRIIPIGDVHLGTVHCDLDALRQVVRYIAATPHCYWLGMGDYLECIRHTDRRFDPRVIPERHLARLADVIESQVEEFLEICRPILCREKCLGLLRGNHEEMALLYHGVDPVDRLVAETGVRDLGYAALMVLSLRRNHDTRTLTVFAHHGHGGGRTAGWKVNRLREMMGFVQADIYLMGHVHDRIVDDMDILCAAQSGRTYRLGTKRVVLATTGTFYRTYGSERGGYAERRLYPPTPIGPVVVSAAPWQGAKHRTDWLHIEKFWWN